MMRALRCRAAVPAFFKPGPAAVVMISDGEYERLLSRSHQPISLVQCFRESPLVGDELNMERDKDKGRDFEL